VEHLLSSQNFSDTPFPLFGFKNINITLAAEMHFAEQQFLLKKSGH
jgi:hypothetical protein